jgi:hypothetical protein
MTTYFACPNGCAGKSVYLNGTIVCCSCKTPASWEPVTAEPPSRPTLTDPTRRRRVARR